MKIFKTFLLTLCASLFALCLGLTACEGDNDAPPPRTVFRYRTV